jgi:hypothetical protein
MIDKNRDKTNKNAGNNQGYSNMVTAFQGKGMKFI